jgi:hypothetical protein
VKQGRKARHGCASNSPGAASTGPTSRTRRPSKSGGPVCAPKSKFPLRCPAQTCHRKRQARFAGPSPPAPRSKGVSQGPQATSRKFLRGCPSARHHPRSLFSACWSRGQPRRDPSGSPSPDRGVGVAVPVVLPLSEYQMSGHKRLYAPPRGGRGQAVGAEEPMRIRFSGQLIPLTAYVEPPLPPPCRKRWVQAKIAAPIPPLTPPCSRNRAPSMAHRGAHRPAHLPEILRDASHSGLGVGTRFIVRMASALQAGARGACVWRGRSGEMPRARSPHMRVSEPQCAGGRRAPPTTPTSPLGLRSQPAPDRWDSVLSLPARSPEHGAGCAGTHVLSRRLCPGPT